MVESRCCDSEPTSVSSGRLMKGMSAPVTMIKVDMFSPRLIKLIIKPLFTAF